LTRQDKTCVYFNVAAKKLNWYIGVARGCSECGSTPPPRAVKKKFQA